MNGNEKVKKFYNSVADEYNDLFYIRKNDYPPLKFRHNYILKMISDENLDKDSNILDSGCGPGELVLDLAKKFTNLYGSDISEEMIRISTNKLENSAFGDKNIQFRTGDAEKLEYSDNFFDAVICSGLVEYLQDDEKWLGEVFRVLKPGGILIVNVTNKFAVRRWTLALFAEVKKIPGIFKLMNLVKTRIFKMEPLNRFPFRPRVHSPRRFDAYIESKGFSRISHNYFDFSIFPYPIDTALNFAFLKVRKNMEKYSAKNAVIWANGYIVKFRKNIPSA